MDTWIGRDEQPMAVNENRKTEIDPCRQIDLLGD